MDRRKTFFSWGVLFVLALATACTNCTFSKEERGGFEERQIDIADYGLFDLGVTDFNNDNLLDIFTVNHSGGQSLLLNKGAGSFEDIFGVMKMDQDRSFPGLVVTAAAPPMAQPGLYVYWNGPDIVVRTYGRGQNEAVSGQIDVLSPIEITEKKNVDVAVEAKALPSGATHSTINFSVLGEGYFFFRPVIHALPIQFHLAGEIPVNRVYVGHHLISPASSEFSIFMRDRHGMAWIDLNDDDRMDVFITRGGLRGTMASVPLKFWDELFVSSHAVMEDVGQIRGLEKDGCAGRQAAWVDYNSDERMDIYVDCGREIHEGVFPNKLFQQTADGQFVDVAPQVGLDLKSDGTFLWLDTDLDGDMDLFWSDEQGFALYVNESGRFVAAPIAVDFRCGRSEKISMADIDNDGDSDIFSASSKGNVLFVNTQGTLSAVDPSVRGLPQKSETANWVDYDNDGWVDLHAVPGGLYRQAKNNSFASTAIMDVEQGRLSPFKLNGSRVAWFDADNNGTRDLIQSNQFVMKRTMLAKLISKMTGAVERFGKLSYFWETRFFLNKNTSNHWLALQLVGPPWNRQAIGARTTLVMPEGKQMQQVGWVEGSHYSQGHYRLYFGLGENSKTPNIIVNWPDGQSIEIKDPAIDQLHTVQWRRTDGNR